MYMYMYMDIVCAVVCKYDTCQTKGVTSFAQEHVCFVYKHVLIQTIIHLILCAKHTCTVHTCIHVSTKCICFASEVCVVQWVCLQQAQMNSST